MPKATNVSREFQAHLERLVREKRAERWRDENQKAFEAYAKYVAKHGIWNEDSRDW